MSSQQLSQALTKNFDPQESQLAIERLIELGLIDDLGLLQEQISNNRGKRAAGDLLLLSKLSQIGFSESEIQEVIDTFGLAERDRAIEVAIAKFPSHFKHRDPLDPRDLARIARFLASRGYTEETIASILDERAPS